MKPLFWTNKADSYVGLALYATHLIVHNSPYTLNCGSKEEAWSHIDHDNGTHEQQSNEQHYNFKYNSVHSKYTYSH